MLHIYRFGLVVGGIFVLLSVFAGVDGADFDQNFDSDLEIADDRPKEENNTRSRRKWGHFWLPIFSLRFWTFGSCFFGLTGLLLSAIRPTLPQPLIASLAIAIGVLCGTSIVSVLHRLRHSQANSLVRSRDLIGLGGTVEIPFDRTSKGKVRIEVKGSMVDFVACTEEAKAFAKGENVFVVGRENNKVWVVSEDALAPS